MKILVTGGAGFIGGNFLRWMLKNVPDAELLNFDKLTYAGNLASLSDFENSERYTFFKGDITDVTQVEKAFCDFAPEIVINFAAESHVDRSILDATEFVCSNIVGTQIMLDASRRHNVSRFCQVSTDEVYGSLTPDEPPFTEDTPLAPNSPYAASKAGADMLVRSYFHTHNFPVITTRCSNNYGPFQFPEKFIPLFIKNALEDKDLPLYGDGKNVRDWIHVLDHCSGVWAAASKGTPGEVYNFGCDNEWMNIDIVTLLLKILGKPESLIKFVKDRPGHDRRYAMGFAKSQAELGWSPQYTFENGLQETVDWYLKNTAWTTQVTDGSYREYYDKQYGEE